MTGPWLLSLALAAVAAQAPAPVAEAEPAPLVTAAPPTFTLDQLVTAAEEHYPRRREKELRGEIADRRIDNLDARFLPDLQLTGQAAYHSNVPSLPAGLGASPPQDQYVVALDADQRIWDGGRTAGEKAVEEASRDLDVAAVDVDAYDWRQQVEAVYFGVLAKNAEIDLLKTLVEDLEAQLSVLDARVDAGVALAGDQASLAAEAEGQRQRIVEAEGERRAALAQLSTLSGQVIPDDAVLATPDPQPPADLVAAATAAATGEGVDRPEIEQAKATRQLLQEQMHLVGLATKPTVSAFAQGGIGRPADQDFFETDPTPYVVLGLRVRWKPLDWGVSEREQEIRDLQLGINGSRLDTFFTSLSASLRRLAERIESSRAVLASDDRIVELRRQSSEQAAAQLRAGVITPSAYLLERNAEHRARLTREQHHLSLIRDSVDFVTTLGDSS